MATMAHTLPSIASLSSSVIAFLDDKLHSRDELERASNLASELHSRCADLDRSLVDLNHRLEASLVAYASYSDRIGGLSNDINSKLSDLSFSTRVSGSLSDGRGTEGLERSEQILGEELPSLAKEVTRVETVRIYAETALKLDTLVGDIEDAVSSTTNKNLRKHPSSQNLEDMRLVAIKALKLTEDVLASVTKTRPQWARLISAVDHRVDRALAILRPQAIADHRALLTSLGWPPPLSTLNSSDSDARKRAEVQNPLFTMQGDLKHQYCENFIALCNLQEFQRRRKSRQLEGHNREVALHQPLWAIEELVNPISIASQRHFSQWVDKPEFIFALVYKLTRDYVDSMDELLQPLVDEAMLSGYSCREEWISAMVLSLSTYLAKDVFPLYVGQLEEENVSGIRSQGRISWLHLVDLMIAFDKRVQSLVAQSGILPSLQEDGNLQKISSLSVFCDRPDWLDLWAEIELTDTFDKLKPEIEDERSWLIKIQGGVISGVEDYKSPAIASAFLRRLSSVVDRSRSLPAISLRSRFIQLAGLPLVRKFVDCLLVRCQEAEGLTAMTDDDSLIKVTKSINAAHYFESVLKEWCEDVFFLEMGLKHSDQLGIPVSESGSIGWSMEERGTGIFDEEIGKLEEFRTEWVEKLSTVVLRGFDSRCRDYIKNKKQWQEKGEEGLAVSKYFVAALDYLQGKMSVVEEGLNGVDFVGLWRSLATGVDRLLFSGVLISNVKFHDGGVERLGADLAVLFGVFGAWCLRPEGFFPKVADGLKLLRMTEKQLKDRLTIGERWLKEIGIRHLSVREAEKIVKNRVYIT
ncbi:RINT1-like protein MAG2 [Actinidia eriantha]|uniref:RINT1-like protein MAG2 n=1 Tax=Actinidia eriantha TaxID=165200 RepID=UPI00258ABCAD|nr:RINT1-like protein MAG2 [Actinidia eriantha]